MTMSARTGELLRASSEETWAHRDRVRTVRWQRGQVVPEFGERLDILAPRVSLDQSLRMSV